MGNSLVKEQLRSCCNPVFMFRSLTAKASSLVSMGISTRTPDVSASSWACLLVPALIASVSVRCCTRGIELLSLAVEREVGPD